jgi:DNA-directed RNA polymerase beta' subunit
MHADELKDMAKQQFILGVRSNLMRERLIVKRPKNLREAIEYARLLEVANKTVRGSVSSNIKNVFATMSIFDFENNIEEETNNNVIKFNSDYAKTQYELINCWSCGK